MLSINKARQQIAQNPGHADMQVLAGLLQALESETPFLLADLYRLDYALFELCTEIIDEWRLDRHYSGNPAARNTAWLTQELQPGAPLN